MKICRQRERVLANFLESADAKALLETMPTPEQLMPAITVEEMQKTLSSGKEQQSYGRTQ
jgi:hypothetical protein